MYCQQLDQVYNKLKKEYPALDNRGLALFPQSKASLHCARLTKEKLRQMDGAEILPHPTFSTDAAPSGYGFPKLLRVTMNFQRVLHFELVPHSCTINAKLYCKWLKKEYPALVNWGRALFHQDNARPYNARLTEMDSVEILPNPPFSTDTAPTDYDLILLNGILPPWPEIQHFWWNEGSLFTGVFFLYLKPVVWYLGQIWMLAYCWQKIAENDGFYFEEEMSVLLHEIVIFFPLPKWVTTFWLT